MNFSEANAICVIITTRALNHSGINDWSPGKHILLKSSNCLLFMDTVFCIIAPTVLKPGRYFMIPLSKSDKIEL